MILTTNAKKKGKWYFQINIGKYVFIRLKNSYALSIDHLHTWSYIRVFWYFKSTISYIDIEISNTSMEISLLKRNLV